MGLGRVIKWAVLGPLIFYWLLLGHVFCRMWFQHPEPIEIEDFPEAMTREERDKVVMGRKQLIADAKEAIAGNMTTEFVEKYMTQDGEFEDFWMLWKGHEEFNLLLQWTSHAVHWVTYPVKGEHHGPNHIVLDWTQEMMTSYLPWVVRVPMRTNLLLRREGGGKEKVYRYYEEWWGNRQLNRETTFPALGVLHERLRYFTGQLLASAVRAGLI